MRADLDTEIASFIFAGMPYLVSHYTAWKGITDPDEVERVKHYCLYRLLQYGLRGKE